MSSSASHPATPWPTWIKALSAALFSAILLLAAVEFYRAAPVSGVWLGKLSIKWGIGFTLLCLSGLLLAGLAWLALLRPGRLAGLESRLVAVRLNIFRSPTGSRTWLCWFTALIVIALPPVILLYTPLAVLLLDGAFIRLLILLGSAAMFAYLTASDPAHLANLADYITGLLFAAAIYIPFERISRVSAYPFSLAWSEGNRLFDYWMVVHQQNYAAAGLPVVVPNTYRLVDLGRGWLWGILFLVPNTPIWLHRLWNVTLWILPYLLVGLGLAGLARRTGASRWLFAFWIFLFLFQGPVYPSLLFSAALVVFLVRPGHWWRSVLAIIPASYYAALSRWTWLPAAAAWGGMILLSDFEWKKAEGYPTLLRRLLLPAAAGLIGLAAGALANNRMISPEKLSTSMALSQPRLWGRLLPNVNYPEGLLLGLCIATLPVVVILVWLTWSRRWALNWIQATAYLAVELIFLGMGLFASVKIGGGNNLHNLDMLLISLAVLAALALRAIGVWQFECWPAWARGMLLLACLIPAWNAMPQDILLRLPPEDQVRAALQTIQTKVSKASKRGPVLFIDQRQLLIFGTIRDLPMMPDYEKKYLMDKAMAGDTAYFERFYADLRARRFSMIVTEPLYYKVQGSESGFQQENNAWVQWVAGPLLCYYAPVETLTEVRVQLLVPKNNPQNCP